MKKSVFLVLLQSQKFIFGKDGVYCYENLWTIISYK